MTAVEEVARLTAENKRLRSQISAAADLLISALEDDHVMPVARQRLRLVGSDR